MTAGNAPRPPARRGVRARARQRAEQWVARVAARAVDGAVHRAVSASVRPQTEDVWSRYAIRSAEGNLVALIPALNEMYARLNRIEGKLNLLLGHRSEPRTNAEAVRRTVTLDLPRPPAGWSARATPPPAQLSLDVAWGMFVAQTLEQKGIGGYEPTTLPHYLAALEHAPRGAVLDIGANIGPYALLARAFSDREVVGFEPTPDLAATARRCGELSGLDYRVEELALGDHDGRVELYLSDSTDSSNSLNAQFRRYSNVLDVALERLDAYVERTGVRPGLLKVDTETTEPAVLRGAAGTVHRTRPWILCEVLAGHSEDELNEVVGSWGYRCYHLDAADRLHPVERIAGDPDYRALMYLLTPEPPPEPYWERVRDWDAALRAVARPSA